MIRFGEARAKLPGNGMLNLKNPNLATWPENLEPRGEGTFDKEPFSEWWDRAKERLNNLHPKIAEQWIFRHWTHSYFSFLPLDQLSWRREVWDTERVIRQIVRYGHDDCEYTPDFDYRTFQRAGGSDRHPTALALDTGTWDFPVVVLETPRGFIDARRARPDARYVLIEGHLRMRYLNALHHLGYKSLGPHQLFVLTSQIEF